MTNRIRSQRILRTCIVLGTVAALSLVGTAFAAKTTTKEATPDQSSISTQQPLHNVMRGKTAEEIAENQSSVAVSGAPRRSLGQSRQSASALGVGFTMDSTWADFQWVYTVRQVGQRGNDPSNHFAFISQVANSGGVLTSMAYAYNRYNPTAGGSWVILPPGSCRIQDQGPTEVGGLGITSDVTPRSLANGGSQVIISGRDNRGQARDNHIYQDLGGCFWGIGDRIGINNYRTGFANAADFLAEPQIEVQIIGTDTITHVAGSESVFRDIDVEGFLQTETVVQYFRKVNNFEVQDSTLWSAAQTLTNAAAYRPNMTASRVSSEVAVIYPKLSTNAVLEPASLNAQIAGAGLALDLDVFYRESVNGGVSFNPEINITNYGTRTVKSWATRNYFSSLYDTDGNLHITFAGEPWPAGIYDSVGFFYADFSSAILHWSQSATNKVRVANGEYGLQFNTAVCGFDNSYVASQSIGECDGNLYMVWEQTHNIKNANVNDTVNNIYTDCTTLPGGGRLNSANSEIWMSVSTNLTGALWDKARNLSNTFSRDCDSATGGGVCLGEKSVSVARYGQANSGAFTWPSGSSILGTGTHFLGMTFIEDQLPGAFVAGFVGNNAIKFGRLNCVDPVIEALISASPTSAGYPSFAKHGSPRVLTITVTNDGTANLNITSIASVVTSGPVGVITNSNPGGFTVPAGVGGTGSFTITINPGGLVNAPGTVVPAIGYVYVKSNAANDDSLAIALNYVVADTVVLASFDTVSTGQIRLAISTNGAEGLSGIGRANLDFVSLGGDCDSANSAVYLFSGGPLVNRRLGPGNYVFTGSTFSDQIGDFTFKPLTDNIGGPTDRGFTSTGTRERFSTGLIVNKDTTIGAERVWYAPKLADSTDFIVICTRYWAITGSVSSVQIGDVHDLDIPSINGSQNKDGAEASFVWLRGTEGATANCAPMATRFGANVPLGQYFTSQAACTNDDPFGQYSINNTADLTNDITTGIIDPDTSWNRSGGFGAIGNLGADSVDMRVITTWKHNITLPAGDTLFTYSALTTVKNGTLANLQGNAAAACAWYASNLRPGCTVCGCCVGVRGNVDGDGGESVDIADLTVLVDHLFISFTPLICETEGDMVIDASVDIGDLTFLVDHLFISFTPQPPC